MKSKTYKKWRELSINPFEIKFNNIVLDNIISYPHAGNDVVECFCYYKNKKTDAFIKIERSKVAELYTEKNNIELLRKNKYYNKIPKILDYCKVNNKDVLVLKKIDGRRLSEIFSSNIKKNILEKYLFKYGNELAIIHSICPKKFGIAKQRVINDIPNNTIYKNWDDKLNIYINYLNENRPNIEFNCFIHGDFHYANILWKNSNISGVLDFEYSGKGFKEHDIAWSIVLRPNQVFFDSLNDIKCFLNGYKINSKYDNNKLKWCLINSYCHFYLMNIENNNYKEILLKLMNSIINTDL